MFRILFIAQPTQDEMENYLYAIDKIIRIGRITYSELNHIEILIHHSTKNKHVFSSNDIIMYFEHGCIKSRIRPKHYWNYIFSQL